MTIKNYLYFNIVKSSFRVIMKIFNKFICVFCETVFSASNENLGLRYFPFSGDLGLGHPVPHFLYRYYGKQCHDPNRDH